MVEQIGNGLKESHKYLLTVYSVLKIAALYAVVMALLTYPWVFHLGDLLPSHWQSPPFVSIMLNNHNALLLNPLKILDAGYFYPINNTLALTENLIGYTIFFSPIYILTGNPTLSFNVMIWLFFVLSATSLFLLIKYYLNSPMSAFVGGLIYGFASYRFGNIDDIHMINLMCLPLAVLFLEKGIETGKWRFFALLAGCVVLQIYSGLYHSWFLALCLLIFAIFNARRLLDKAVLMKLLAAASVTLLLVLPLVYVYVDIRISYAYKQWEDTLQWLGMDVVDYMRVMKNNVIYSPILMNQKNDILRRYCAFPGFFAVALAVYGIFSKSLKGRTKGMLLAITAVCLLFSLGTYLKWNNELTSIPLPYLLVTEVFSYIRCSWRFVFPFMFGLACFSALGFHRIATRLNNKTALLLTCAVTCIIILENLNIPMTVYKVETPDEHIYSLVDGPLVEYPSKVIEGTGDHFKDYWKREYLYMYYQAFHKQKIVNGVVSYHPAPRFETDKMVNSIPSDDALKYFSALGVKYVIVHKDMFLRDERRYRAEEFDVAGLSKILETENTVLFKLDRKVKTCKDIWVVWDLIREDKGAVHLRMTFMPAEGCVWVNPKQSKIEKVSLKIYNRENVLQNSESVDFSLPLVLLEEIEYLIPAGNIDIYDELVTVLDFGDDHFTTVSRRDEQFRSP